MYVTTRAVYIKREIVTRSRNPSCSGNATVPSLCLSELHVTVNNAKILIVGQQCFYVEFISPSTMKVGTSSCKLSDVIVSV
jgi:hypothetical protein